MVVVSLALYSVGVIGLFISIALLALKLHKKQKNLSIFIVTLLIVSFICLSCGTILSLLHLNKNDISKNSLGENLIPKKNNIDSQNKINLDKKASLSDLKVNYDILDTPGNLSNDANILITNTSDYVFNGNIVINFFDSNNNETNTFTLPIKNLLPHSEIKSNMLVDKHSKSLKYSFKGQFIKYDEKDYLNTYIINSVHIGNGFFRFNVIVDDTSTKNLMKISEEFNTIYNKDLCNGFLIYFFTESNTKFSDSFAEVYTNNKANKSNLLIYSSGEKININITS